MAMIGAKLPPLENSYRSIIVPTAEAPMTWSSFASPRWSAALVMHAICFEGIACCDIPPIPACDGASVDGFFDRQAERYRASCMLWGHSMMRLSVLLPRSSVHGETRRRRHQPLSSSRHHTW